MKYVPEFLNAEVGEWEMTGRRTGGEEFPVEVSVREAHISGTTVTEVAVNASGHPTACRVTRTSGSRDLDVVTCQLILLRFKFRPARNAAGQAVGGSIEYEQEWDAPPPPPPDPGER